MIPVKRWLGYVWEALQRAYIHPVWGLNEKLGPFAAVLPVVAAIIVGLVTKDLAWGLVGLLGGLLLMTVVALVVEVAHEDKTLPPVPISDTHRDDLKAMAQRFRGQVSGGRSLTETDDDWHALAGHFPDVATQLRAYNERLTLVTMCQLKLRSHIGKMVDESPIAEDRKTTAYDFVVKLVEKLVPTPNALTVSVTFRWEEVNGSEQVSTDITAGNFWGIIAQGVTGRLQP